MKEPTSDELKWIGIDFDKTIADNDGYPNFQTTKIMPGTKKAIQKIWDMGFKPVIYTARGWQEHAVIKDWLNTQGIEVYSIICGKPLFRCFIDDRAIHFDNNWKEVLEHKLFKGNGQQ